MNGATSPLALSATDRDRIFEVDRLAGQGAPAVSQLIGKLADPSWAVRRAVVLALARVGEPAVAPMTETLVKQRDDEARIAAVVDALSVSRGDVNGAMIRLLEVAHEPSVLCDAAQVLGRRRSADASALLARLTTHADDNVAVASIEALGRIGGAAGLDALIALVRGKNFFRVMPSIDVLGRSGEPRALDPLLALLGSPRYALDAARALGRTGEVAAAAPLVALLRRSSDSLTRVIASSLRSLEARSLERYGNADAVHDALRLPEDPMPVVQRLAQSVAGATPEEQESLCTVLAWIRDSAAAATLIELLDAAPQAAGPALRALGRESDPQLFKALREGDSNRRSLLLPLVGARTRDAQDLLGCLDDPDPGVRILACNALARVGDVSAVPKLFELLAGPDPMLSQAVVGALQSLGSSDTQRLALAAARSPDASLRRGALRIVAYFGYPAGLQVLIDAVEGGDDRLRDVAIHGLALMDDPRALAALLHTAAHLNPRARAAAMRALGQSQGAGKIVTTLRAGLRDPDAWVRYYSCQSLGKLGDDGAIDLLLELVHDPAGQVRVASIEALARLEAPAALAALREAAASDDPDLQRAALLGLGSRKVPEALPALIAALGGADGATRLIALSAIAAYDQPEALAALAAATSDSESSVRDAAIGVLAGRREPGATTALIQALRNPLTREHAAEALASPVGGRIGTIASTLESADADLAGALISALARMRRSDAVAAVVDALALPNVAARRAAASALAALRSSETRPFLEQAAADDADEEVRRAALSGLGP